MANNRNREEELLSANDEMLKEYQKLKQEHDSLQEENIHLKQNTEHLAKQNEHLFILHKKQLESNTVLNDIPKVEEVKAKPIEYEDSHRKKLSEPKKKRGRWWKTLLILVFVKFPWWSFKKFLWKVLLFIAIFVGLSAFIMWIVSFMDSSIWVQFGGWWMSWWP